MLLDGKTALVTGASRGIGRAVALALAAAGARVAINYAGNVKAAEEVKAAVEAAGGTAILCQADVADSAAVEAMVAAVAKEFGTIDILVNNAGITRDTLLMRMKDEDFAKVLDTNLKGVFYCTKAVSKLMMKKRAGRIGRRIMRRQRRASSAFPSPWRRNSPRAASRSTSSRRASSART